MLRIERCNYCSENKRFTVSHFCCCNESVISCHHGKSLRGTLAVPSVFVLLLYINEDKMKLNVS